MRRIGICLKSAPAMFYSLRKRPNGPKLKVIHRRPTRDLLRFPRRSYRFQVKPSQLSAVDEKAHFQRRLCARDENIISD